MLLNVTNKLTFKRGLIFERMSCFNPSDRESKGLHINYIINKRAVWGEMTRKGFSGKKSEVKPNTAESSGVGGVS